MNQKPERWSASELVPGMRLDPAQDPREASEAEPAGERATCERYLRDYRLAIELNAKGGTRGNWPRDRSRPPRSACSACCAIRENPNATGATG